MDETWRLAARGLDTVRGELWSADAAVREAIDGLGCAQAIGWESPAADAFRARLDDLTARVRQQAVAVDETRRAAARLAAR